MLLLNASAPSRDYTLSLHDALPILAIATGIIAPPPAACTNLAATSQTRLGLSAVGSLKSPGAATFIRSEEHTSELQSHSDLVCRLLLEKNNLRLQFMETGVAPIMNE